MMMENRHFAATLERRADGMWLEVRGVPDTLLIQILPEGVFISCVAFRTLPLPALDALLQVQEELIRTAQRQLEPETTAAFLALLGLGERAQIFGAFGE